MSLNIKNEDTHRLIRELAHLTGENQTEALTVAVRERLERVKQKRAGSLADRLVAIGKDIARRLPEDFKKIDHDALLYNERGMPR